VNSHVDQLAMTPRLHQQNSVSSHRVGLNDSFSLSQRSSLQMQRSSAEQSEIEKELNRNKRKQNSVTSSFDKNQDPEAVKKSMQLAMQTQLQTLINKISEKEKLFTEQEKQYTKMQAQLAVLETRTNKIEVELKHENNLNA